MADGRTLSTVIAAPRAVPEYSCRRASSQTLHRSMAEKTCLRGREINLPEMRNPGGTVGQWYLISYCRLRLCTTLKYCGNS
ncbi:hypothetical protein DPMN_184366 [Dreissena polymorpha]|uniref:Uncharacterized protein n=1 Tax=Dreissena polymorpha TaxID=45954 RepID=A0A9D4DJE1_DREPO|nr:hypothetical protein DPMN_184366 [Dreissena polymorpha]